MKISNFTGCFSVCMLVCLFLLFYGLFALVYCKSGNCLSTRLPKRGSTFLHRTLVHHVENYFLLQTPSGLNKLRVQIWKRCIYPPPACHHSIRTLCQRSFDPNYILVNKMSQVTNTVGKGSQNKSLIDGFPKRPY